MTATRASRRRWNRYLYVAPLLLILLLLGVVPTAYAVYLSFFDFYLTRGGMTFAGLDNYVAALTDEAFYRSMWVNVQIIVAALTLEFGLGLLLALACSNVPRGRSIIVALLTTPIMVSTTATGMAFRMLMLPEYGPLNAILAALTGGPVVIDWLGDVQWAVWSLVIANVWRATPFVMLILMAGLAGINHDLYEAARIDGSSGWQIFRFITMPLLRGPFFVAFLIRLIDLIKLFDLVLLLTQGGPARVTETVSFYVYYTGLRFFRVGYGATLSLFLLVICIVLTLILLRVTQRREVELGS